MNYWTCGHICGEGGGWFVLHEIRYSVASNFFFSFHFFPSFSSLGFFHCFPLLHINISVLFGAYGETLRLSIYIFIDASNLRLIKFVILESVNTIYLKFLLSVAYQQRHLRNAEKLYVPLKWNWFCFLLILCSSPPCIWITSPHVCKHWWNFSW